MWTDGTILVHADGSESARFHVHDGYGVRRLQALGVTMAVISGRKNPAVEKRARALNIGEVHLGRMDKGALIAELMTGMGLTAEQVAVMGDDLPDLPMFERSGLCIAPPNAVAEVRAQAHYITSTLGGHGALREACELLAAARGLDFANPPASPGAREP